MGVQGRPLTVEMKETIVSLKGYFDRTKSDPNERCSASVDRVANALGVGVATVKRVMADHNRGLDFTKEPESLRGRRPRAVSDSLQTVTRTFVRSANKEGRHITLDDVFQHLETLAPGQDFTLRTLGRTLDRWGFTFGKGTRTQRLKEKEHVVTARRHYLRQKRANRRQNETIRPEVYLDESYVNKNHSNDFVWYLEEDGPWIQKPTGKGERLIIIHAITQQGWVPDARLVFKSTSKRGDYHGQMNQDMFEKWFKEKLLPNIPDNSLIIMDNASYHNVLSQHSAPTAACTKDRIRRWLQKNRMPIGADCLKAEMVEILKKVAPSPVYKLDELAAEYGHEILRTPPYHPELQPIEKCWALVKNRVARKCDFTMANLLTQLDGAFEAVTAKACSALIRKVRTVEDQFWEEDTQLERE